MLKRLASATRITTAILMVVSILMPTSIAEASGNITKAVTVRGINGQPYEGASVTLKYEPTSGSKDKTVYLDPVTTLQNGVASLTFPDNLKGATLIIQPPASDTVTATYTNYGENWGISTPVTINLIKRNATINILKPNGDSVGAGAGIWVAEGAFYQLIRGGNTGISVDPTTATDTCLRTEVYPPDTLQDSFSRAYGVKVVGSGDSRVLSFYNDVATCLNETPKINGVYQLKLNPANVSGTLKNSSGQAITFGPGEGYKVQIWGLNQDGTNDWSKVASGSFSTSNGGWTGFIDTSTAGTFEIVFSGYGGANFPYFANNYIYVTADHKLSWISATDTSGSNTAIRDFNIPQANFSIRTFDSATATLIDSTFEFRKKTTNPNETRFMGYTSVLGSATSASLSNGDYVVQAYGFPNGNPTIEFTVLGSEITVTSSTDLGSGWTYTRSGNNFTLTSRPSNAKLKIVDVNGAGVGANIQFVGVINSRKVSKWAHTDNLGNADLYLVNGTYNYVYIEPDNSSINGSIRTTATVVDGVLTMATGNHETDGSWTLQLPINNLLLNVVYPNNSPLYDANLNPLAWINFWNADANWNSTTQASNPQIGADGKAGAFLPNGRYILDLELRTDAEVTSNNGFASRKYRVTVASDVITITSDGLPITPVDSVFTISPYVANLDILVQNSAGETITGNVTVWDKDSNGNQINPRDSRISSTGHAYFYFNSANGVVRIQPDSTYADLAEKNYPITSTEGVIAINGASKVGAAWALPPAVPNFRLYATVPITNSLFTSGYVQVLRVDDQWQGNEIYDMESFVIDFWEQSQGLGRAYLPNGNYLITINPHSVPENVGLAAQTYRVIVADSGISMTLNGANVSAVDGRFPIKPSASNFDLLITKPNGDILTNGSVDYCQVYENGNIGGCRGYGISQTGTLSLYLATGTWKVNVRPGRGVTDVTTKTYDVVVTDGVPIVTGVEPVNNVWTLITGIPNLSGTLSLAAGGILSVGNNQNVGLQIQKFINGNWQYQNGNSWTNSVGWAMTFTQPVGQYRLVARPWGFADLVESYSDPFWVDASNKFSLTEDGVYADALTGLNIALRAPNLKVKVVNPLAQPLEPGYLPTGGWINIMKVLSNNGQTWITNMDIQPSNPGLTGANISDPGTYILRVNPPNGSNAIVGLAAREYQMTIDSLGAVAITFGGVAVPVVEGRFVLTLAKSNVTARILRADGTPAVQSNGKWVGVNLQKLDVNGNWQWTSNTNTDDNGYVSFRIDSAGKYRLRIEPYGDSLASVTYSADFTVAEGEINALDKQFGSITLAGPSIRVAVASASAPSVTLENANIEIRKDGRWIDWANTSLGKVAGISLSTEGTYEFIVTPSQDQQSTNARKSYKVVATKVDGVIVAEVIGTESDGVSVANGVTTLLLGTPSLSGTVKDPTGTVLQAGSQVYAIDIASGKEMWEYSTQTNSLGRWSMMLPAGRYKIYARAPWGTSDFGGSAGIGEVLVAADGTALVPQGYSATAFEIRLKAPTWSGVVKAPGTSDTVIPQARVCLMISNIWTCTNADQNGHFALSAPESFASFENTNPLMDIADDMGRAYPMNRIQGAENVLAALGGLTSQSVVLRLKAANTEITVTTSLGAVASNVWVTAERDGVGYLGGGSTDNNGVAKLNIDNPELPFKVRVDVNGNQEIAANFAPATKSFTQTEINTNTTNPGTSNSIFHGSVTLSPPNFRFIVQDPTGIAVGNTWVELLSGSDGPWLGGTSVDYNGFGNFKLDVPTTGSNYYTMTVNPSWNATTNYTRQAYTVQVRADGTITVQNKTSVRAVNTTSILGKTVYPLALGTPSVIGVVVDPNDNTVAQSWIVPYNADTNEGYWQQGVNSRNNGDFAMNLASGSYKLEANVPWGTSGVAKSAQCAITVESETVSSGGSCFQSGTNGSPNTVKLQLRAPNVKFTLKIDGVPVANANVGVGAGRWWTNAQSNSQGVVSLFIDAAAIRELNNSTTSQQLRFWVDPAYGSTDMARWDCGSGDNKPICMDLPDAPASGDYVGKTSVSNSDPAPWVVEGVKPNTRVKIVDPETGDELPNSWVSIFAMNSYGNQWWLGGGNSGINGFVAMNIETETAFAAGFEKLVLEVQAPWNQRTIYAANLYTNNGAGYTYDELVAIADFSPATPNLKLSVVDSNNKANRYGWVGIEEVDSSGNYIKWVGGYGLNENGSGAVFLAASKNYKITSYPGPGRAGASTPCIVTTNGGTPPVVATDSAECGGLNVINGELAIRLNGGNVVGTVTRADGTPVVGAAVYANIPGAATEASAVITVTDETGHYDLQLTAGGLGWNITVFPVPSVTDPLEVQSSTSAIIAPANGAVTTPFVLAAGAR